VRNYSPQICGLHIDALRSGALGAVGRRNSWGTAEICCPMSIRSAHIQQDQIVAPGSPENALSLQALCGVDLDTVTAQNIRPRVARPAFLSMSRTFLPSKGERPRSEAGRKMRHLS